MYRGFWYAQALDSDSDLAPPLEGSVDADVCIVGGGFLGLWSALRLKQAHPEWSVVVVERDRCGSGASGRNGGIATNWWAKYLSLLSICGEIEAKRICEASNSAIDEIEAALIERVAALLSPTAIMVEATQPVIVVGATFCTGFVPLDMYPEWIQPVVGNQPMSLAVDAMRGLSIGGPVWSPLTGCLLWCAAIILVCLWPITVGHRRAARGGR